MKNPKSFIRLIPAALICAGTLSAPAFATNGYYTHGLGVKNKAMAGAGTASPDETIAAATNPAAAIHVSEDWEVGLSIFSPRRSYSASSSLANGNGGAFTIGAGTVESGSEYFPIPYVGKAWKLDEDSALAFNFYGRGGMNTDYTGGTAILDPDGPGPAPVMTLPGSYGGGNAGVDLMQAFLDLTYARDLGNLSVGISGVFSMQMFKITGAGTFAGFTKTFAASGGTVMPSKLTNNGRDMSTGFGIKVGAIYRATDAFSLSAAYQSQFGMSELDDYSDLFAEGGGFDIPSAIRLGASLQATDKVRLHFDYEHIAYSNVDSVGNPIAKIFGCPTAGAGGTDLESCLGGSNGAGFGWEDMDVYKFGLEYRYSGDMVIRGGYSVTEQPIQNTQVLFNILAPGVMEQHFTVGMTRTIANGRELSVSFMYAPSKSVNGVNTFDPTQTLKLEMNQFELEIGYRF